MTNLISESGKQTNASCYLSEYIVRRQATRKNITLPKAYWTVQYKGKYIEWIKILNRERVRARALLHVYDLPIILKALQANTWIISLFVRRLETVLQELQRQSDLLKTTANKPITIVENITQVPKSFGQQSKRSKLKD